MSSPVPPSDQGSVAGTSTAVTSLSVVLTKPIKKGSAIIVLVSDAGAGFNVTSITGGSGATWTNRQIENNAGSGIGAEIWDSLAQADQASAPTIVVHFPSQTFVSVVVLVFPSIVGFDVASGTTGTGTTQGSGSVTPAQVQELIVAYAGNANGVAKSAGPTNGFTESTQAPNNNTCAYLYDMAKASISTAWTITSQGWTGAIAAYKVAPGLNMGMM